MLTDEELLAWNREGLIPGPEETEEAFIQRALFCLKIREQLASVVGSEIPIAEKNSLLKEVVLPSSLVTTNLFDFFPGWVPVFFSNYHLPPWQGGSTWLFQLTKESPVSALLQMRRAFEFSSTYLGIYQRDEIIAHECVHVGRMFFEEPKFEEILAYMTATSSFRRWWGPIATSPREIVFFFAVFACALLSQFFALSLPILALYFIQGLPFLLFLIASLRLWNRHRQFSGCVDNLMRCLRSPEYARAVAFRLTDKEIISFSKMTPQEISDYAKESATASLRWRLLCKAYWN